MRFGLGFDDVGIGTRVAIESPNLVVIERVHRQTSYGEASHITNVQIVVYPDVSSKRAAERDI
jgi:hypothetical protein